MVSVERDVLIDCNEEGRNCLHLASFYSRFEILEYLLSQRLALYCRDNFGYLPIHLAAQAYFSIRIHFQVEINLRLILPDTQGRCVLMRL